MGHLKDFIYRYLKDSKQREEEITAKNHHLVQDCLIDARKLAGVASLSQMDSALASPLPTICS